MKLYGTAVILLMLLASALISCKPDPRTAGFSSSDDRSLVYSRMGPPSNADDQVVALWSSDNNAKSPSWRQICQRDGFVAVFDENGKSLMSKLSISASGISPTMSDEEIVSYIRAYGPK